MNYYLGVMLLWLLVQTGLATGLKYWSDRRDFMVKSWYVHPVAKEYGDLSGEVGTPKMYLNPSCPNSVKIHSLVLQDFDRFETAQERHHYSILGLMS